MDPYNSDSSDGGSEFPSQSTISEPSPFNDPNYETYKHGQQFMIIDHTANQRNGSEASKIWQHGGERRQADDGTVDGNNKRILKYLETGRGATLDSRVNGKVNAPQQQGPKFAHYAVKHIHFLLHHTSGRTFLIWK
jgi:hypothetical protein